MNNFFNPQKKFKRDDIAELLGISGRQITTLISKGILPTPKANFGLDPLSCIHQYIAYKSRAKESENKVEVSEENEDTLEIEDKKLRLEDKRETIAMKRAKRLLFEKSYAPIDIIVETLQQLGGRLASRHDSLIPKMKIAYPSFPQEAIEVLEAELTAAVNECADILPDLSDYLDGDPNSLPSWLAGDEADDSSFR